MVKLTFFGGAQTVTGSCYLVQTNNCSFLVDCGMFQGPHVESINLEEFQFDAKKIDFVILTHAHIDHSGLLPKLVLDGFKGKIYTTLHTHQITEHLLYDSAKLQENNYRRGEFFGKYTNIRAMIYTSEHVRETLKLFYYDIKFNEFFQPTSSVKIRFVKAGHILGAASVEITIEDNKNTIQLVFSGDIGRTTSHLDSSFDLNHKWNPNYIVMESLYGGVTHPSRDESARVLIDIINNTVKYGGNVYIPAFAVQRTQEILNDIKNAKSFNLLPQDLEVWLDTPLGQKITEIYDNALQEGIDSLFSFPGLKYVKKFTQSINLNKKRGVVIIAGSGMADGGRIVTHLERCIQNKRHTIVFVGFQAEGTLGRELVNGSKKVEINKRRYKVNAKIYHLTGFSAHGDENDYLAWISRYNTVNLKKVFLVHAEPENSIKLQERLNNNNISSTIPARFEEYVLD
ncbi:MAG: MBL fold metallo-hydrolase [Candidatus Dojkabacteria bacterium]|nr:MBL fold metallo-hydrolase [Candidatus Dojkabacteria bacterium]